MKTPTPSIRNVHSQVADRIGISIVRGDIVAGDALPSEMQICEMIDVSRTVVREAIRTLTGKGLVEARAKSGTRVRPPEQWNQLDPDVLRWQLETSDVDSYLAKLFQLRCAVEPAAAALAATEASEDDIARIRAGCDGMAAAKTNEEFVVADIAFHQAIYFATRNEFFWPIAQMFEITLRQSFTIAAQGPPSRAGACSSTARCWMRSRRAMPKARARRPTILLNQAAGDLVQNPRARFCARAKTPELRRAGHVREQRSQGLLTGATVAQSQSGMTL